MSIIREEWRPVVGHEGSYEVSNFGVVRSLDRTIVDGIGRKRRLRGRTIKSTNCGDGYLLVGLGKHVRQSVHSIVATAWIGGRPEGLEVNHKDGNKRNNRLENLEYVSHSENIRHAYGMGLIQAVPPCCKGENHGGSKLSESQVREVRRMYKEGETQSSIAIRFAVSVQLISLVVLRKRWAHVK